jgi:hypothetical protein
MKQQILLDLPDLFNPNVILPNSETSFYEPYYVYDVIPILNKTTNTYENRRRCTAISFSNDGEIVIAFSICSLLDAFKKKVARGKTRKRTIDIIRKIRLNDESYQILNSDKAFYFASIQDYEDFVFSTKAATKLFHTPGKTFLPQKDGTYIKVNGSDIDYWHEFFIKKTYVPFLQRLKDLEIDDRTTEERNSNSSVFS